MEYTTTDLANINAAILAAGIAGFASVTVGGQTVTRMPIADMLALRNTIAAALAAEQTHFGLRMVTLVPPGAG